MKNIRYKSINDITNQVNRIQNASGLYSERYILVANIGATYTNNIMHSDGGTYKKQRRKHTRWQTFANKDAKFSSPVYMQTEYNK